MLCSNSFSKTKEELRAHYILMNMQQDYTTCYIFYKIGSEAIKTTNKDKEILKGIEKSADIVLKFAYETGELLDMKVEDMAAKIKSEMKLQVEEIGNDYNNASILLDKYSLLCKSLIENKKQRIDFWEKKAVNKFK